MDKKRSLLIILVFILLGGIRGIGIENIPFSIIVIIIVCCLIVAIFSIYKNRDRITKKRFKYMIVITLLLISFGSIVIFATFLDNHYPLTSEKYRNIIISLMVINFIAVVLSSVIGAYRNSNKE